MLLVTLPHHISKDVIPTREYSPRWENIMDGVDDSFSASVTMGHLIKKITPELTPFLTPEITPNYVN